MSIDMFPDGFIEYALAEEEKMKKENCSECGKKIEVAIMKNTGVCGENCRKIRDGETKKPSAQVDAGVTNILKQPTGEVNLRGIR